MSETFILTYFHTKTQRKFSISCVFVCFLFLILLYCRFLLVINFIHISVYMSVPIAKFITQPPPHRFPPLVSKSLFSISMSQFLPCKPVHLYHFSRFHTYALINDICSPLSDLLHSVWQSLDSSTSLHMTQFRSFLWLSNIPLCICSTSFFFFSHIFFIHSSVGRRAFRLLPWPGFCK